ncbi:hypothetical protein K5I29_03990 [Flavobacterium agricola]|uniref:Uncharacterized protein n=1 Tax=Flavobacterium agricola TaxID=2870839 RepID=A0ABY6M0W1_9FLAO|nr:hypothetical protein [Flavobacterium agricola]UYW02071.1 hypothetical protein K5I29_03990 [Flavobacterium agricola]
MKKIALLFLLFVGFQSIAQEKFKEAQIDFHEKNDSIDVKKTVEYIMDEKIFGNRKEILNFSMVNDSGVLYLYMQLIEANSDFIPAKCIDKNAKVFIQLLNGKIVSLISTNDVCSQLLVNPDTHLNTRVLSNYFLFAKNNFEDLYESPIAMIRINYGTEHKDYVPKKELVSELTQYTYSPENYFINNLKAVY